MSIPHLDPITDLRRELAVGVLGGSTAIVDYAGLRLVSDPTFDPPGDYGPYAKTEGPAVAPDALGPVDAVLLSHDLHWDNFDRAGRVFAAGAPAVLTGPRAAERLGHNAVGVPTFGTHRLTTPAGRVVAVRAVPAQHGPSDGERDEFGDVNTEVHGFVIESDGFPTIYLSGDNAGLGPVLEIRERFPQIDIAVLHCGAARVPAKFEGRALTLTAVRAVDVAVALSVGVVVPVHHQGWTVYSEDADTVEKAFADAGVGDVLRRTAPGSWATLAPAT